LTINAAANGKKMARRRHHYNLLLIERLPDGLDRVAPDCLSSQEPLNNILHFSGQQEVLADKKAVLRIH